MYEPAIQYQPKGQSWGRTLSSQLLVYRHGAHTYSDEQLTQERTNLDEARRINDKLWEQILALRNAATTSTHERQAEQGGSLQGTLRGNAATEYSKARSGAQQTCCDARGGARQYDDELRLSIVETPQTDAFLSKEITSKEGIRRHGSKQQEQSIGDVKNQRSDSRSGTHSRSGAGADQKAEPHKAKVSEGCSHAKDVHGKEYDSRAIVYLEEKCKLQKREIVRLQGKLNEFTQTQVRYLDEKRELYDYISELRREIVENERRNLQKEKQWREKQKKTAARIQVLEEQLLALRDSAQGVYGISGKPAQQNRPEWHTDGVYAWRRGDESELGLTAERLREVIELQSARIYQLSGDLAAYQLASGQVTVLNGTGARKSGEAREADRKCVTYDGTVEFDALGTDASVSEEFLGYSQGRAGATSEF